MPGSRASPAERVPARRARRRPLSSSPRLSQVLRRRNGTRGRGWNDDDTTFAGIRDWTWGTKGFEVTRWWKAPMHTGSSAGSTSALYMFPKHEPAVVFGAGLPTWVTRARPQDNALFVLAANRTPPSTGLQLWSKPYAWACASGDA